jgi:queuine tRNA-ribosyltransferase
MTFSFSVLQNDSKTRGRLGKLTTAHGIVDTPAFMAVGTRGSIKGVTPEMARACGCQMVLGNTYHLLLRPGPETVAALGGLQKFSGWNGPMLTDSGGFQVFSLAGLREFEDGGRNDERGTPNEESKKQLEGESWKKGSDDTLKRELRTTEDGVVFRSHIDGKVFRLTPQESMRVQHLLGADIIMAFDDCPPADCGAERLRAALERTHRWAEICLREHERLGGIENEKWKMEKGDGAQDKNIVGEGPERAASIDGMATPETTNIGGTPMPRHLPALFGIVQGGTDLEARVASAKFLVGLDLPGYAIGGLAVGEGHARMVQAIAATVPHLPEEKPRYLMGVGYAADILEAVKLGVDMFDCVLPTRNGRNGLAFTMQGTRRMRNARYATDPRPIEEGCDCYACRNFSRGYVRHMFNVEEMLGPTLVSVHNLRFFQRWMERIRGAIREGRLGELVAPRDGLAEE